LIVGLYVSYVPILECEPVDGVAKNILIRKAQSDSTSVSRKQHRRSW